MATPTELASIATTLLEKTNSKVLAWEKDEASGEYSAASSRFVYVVSSRDSDDRAPFTFEVYLLKSDEPILMGEYTTHSTTAATTVTAIRRLYEAAKLSAHGLGSSLSDEVFKDLK